MNTVVQQKVRAFFEQYPSKAFAAGETVLFPADDVPPISYLVNGRVGQYDIAESGTKATLTIFKPGAFFPMSSAVRSNGNPYFFEAIEAVEVRQAPAADVVAFLQHEPDVLFDLLKRLYSGVDGLLGRMVLLMNGSAESRILYELSVSAERFGERLPDGSVAVRITEAQLAGQTGLARETVSRALKRCVKNGSIAKARGTILLKPAP